MAELDVSVLAEHLKEFSDEELLQFLRDEERRLATTRLFFFAKYILQYRDLVEEVHLPICEFLEREDKRKKMLIAPRGSFKSTLTTISYPLWRLILNPSLRILIASETITRASKFLNEIKHHIVYCDRLREIFGDFLMKGAEKWTEFQLTLSQRDSVAGEPSICCSGLDTPQQGMHFELIIADDLHSERNVGTREQIEKVITHYRLLLNILEPNGMLLVVGTPWHFYDLYAYIKEHERESFDIMALSAYKADGSLWFPQRLTEEFLAEQRRLQGSYLFSCMYLCQPQSPETQIFKPEKLKFYETLPKDNYRKFLLIDPAIGEKQVNDFTAFVVVAVNPQNDIYVEEAIAKKGLAMEDYREIIESLREKYNLNNVAIETVAFQRVLKWGLEKMGIYCIELKPDSRNKKMRIRGLQPYYEQGKIYLKREQRELIDELARFPVGENDDCLDALAYVLDLIYPMGKEVAKETSPKFSIYEALGINRDAKGEYEGEKGAIGYYGYGNIEG